MRVALGACAIWAVWWTLNLVAGRLVGRGALWTDPMDALGFDFNHNYLASRCWLSGCNPYFDDFGDPRRRPFIYPPIVLFTFAWTRWLSMATVRVWSVALMAMVVAGAIVAARERRRLGLRPIPYPVSVAAVPWAAPTIFAIERAITTCSPPHSPRRLSSFSFANVSGRTAWPVSAWRLRDGSSSIRSFSFQAWSRCADPGLRCGRCSSRARSRSRPARCSVTTSCTSFRAHAGHTSTALNLAYVLWLLAAGTQLPRVSNDYNLVVLPLGALAVWTGDEPGPVRALLFVSLLWWQPFALWPRAGLVVQFVCKIAGLFAVGRMIADRARKPAAQ
jgi:hypothetical protein